MDTFITCSECGKQTFYTKDKCDFCGNKLVHSDELKNFIERKEAEKQKKDGEINKKIQIQNDEHFKLKQENSFVTCINCGKESFNTKSRCDFCHENLDASKEKQKELFCLEKQKKGSSENNYDTEGLKSFIRVFFILAIIIGFFSLLTIGGKDSAESALKPVTYNKVTSINGNQSEINAAIRNSITCYDLVVESAIKTGTASIDFHSCGKMARHAMDGTMEAANKHQLSTFMSNYKLVLRLAK